jgi:hypothetical protein
MLTAAAAATPTSTPAVAARTPPSTGPANVPSPSNVLEDTFVATSSRGVRASIGTSDITAGGTGELTTAASPARAKISTREASVARAVAITTNSDVRAA